MNIPVSFELAKLLKEKGFDECANARYLIAENIFSDILPPLLQEDCASCNWNDYDDSSTTYWSAPTIADVVMWLYEKHGIWISVYMLDKGEFHWETEFNCEDMGSRYSNCYKTPSEAYEAGIEYVLNNLI